jgi:hypothetical protein
MKPTPTFLLGAVMPSCLRLSLKTKWFEMTKAGTKTEDYRELSPYWSKRFGTPITWAMEAYIQPDFCDTDGVGYTLNQTNYKVNLMTLGYPKSTDTERILKLEHKGIEIRTGNPEWGAEPNKLYFVIMHGVILA